jgi:hypothetical protein
MGTQISKSRRSQSTNDESPTSGAQDPGRLVRASSKPNPLIFLLPHTPGDNAPRPSRVFRNASSSTASAHSRLALPEDLYTHILRHCHRRDIASLSRADRATGRVAKSELYRQIELLRTTKTYSEAGWSSYLNNGGTQVPTLYRPQRVLSALIGSPYTTSRVRVVDLEVIINSTVLLSVIEGLLNRIAPYVSNLRLKFNVFNLVGYTGELPWPLSPFNAISFPQLKRLDLVHATHRNLPWLLTLLDKTPKLRVLSIDTYGEDRVTSFFNRQPPALPTTTGNIVELHISNRGPRLPNHLVDLLRATPNLENLVLTPSPDAIATEKRHDIDLWRIISCKDHLRSLTWMKGSSREFFYAVRKTGGFEKLNKVDVGDHDIKARAIVPQVSLTS